ncbi:hypothetical protein PTMSG1_02837 [Pyrenophora teres f. maculata]|nr:hypothetical protein PTMSG1_02837 [Pyrenophora teres f. maculata]
MAKFLLALLGMAAIALAQDPSSTFVETNTEPYYGPNGLVYPTLSAAASSSASFASNQTTTIALSPTTSAAVYSSGRPANSTLSMSSKAPNSTMTHATTSHTATHSSTSISASRTSSTIARKTTASTSAPAGTGAAAANFPDAVGVIFGGLVAGWAMF